MAKRIAPTARKLLIEQRSPTYAWLATDYDGLRMLFEEQGSLPYAQLAKLACERDGITAPKGGPVSRQVMYAAWLRLHRDMQKRTRPPMKKPTNPQQELHKDVQHTEPKPTIGYGQKRERKSQWE